MSAFTQAQLDRLERAISSGEMTVKYEDRQVTYRSLSDMLRIRDLMRDQLGVDQGDRRRRTVGIPNKGLR